ncbi:hypothetical protein GCM10009716_13860 [Streptomyces sodiiphilus]|uniref:DUF4328 domain-containing protein n=1 Tax=Streptomyces sodiiphilus TaxID=226217 RepID=A0ABN2NXA9_9ACTN
MSPRPWAWLVTVLLAGCVVAAGHRILAAREMLAHLDTAGRPGTAGGTVERYLAQREALVAEDVRVSGLVEAATLPHLAVLVAACCAFLMWFRRVRLNAELFAPRAHRVPRTWLVGGWLVPGLNLYLPRRITEDIWRASRPRSPDGDEPAPVRRTVVHLWWVLWAAAFLTGANSMRMYWETQPRMGSRLASEAVPAAAPVEGALRHLVVADALLAACSVAAALLVWKLSRMQQRLLLQGPPAGPVEPGTGDLNRAQLVGRVVARWSAETDGVPRPDRPAGRTGRFRNPGRSVG